MKSPDKSDTNTLQGFHNIFPREDIINVLDNAPLSEIVCLIASFGCGKTFAVLSWLLSHERKAVWVSLRDGGNLENMFTKRLIGLLPDFGQYASPSSGSVDLKTFLQGAVTETTPDDVKTLVIDNFHFIRDMELLRFVKTFISSLLGAWRVIIISRAELPLVFNDLVLRRHICLLTTRDLSFSPKEIAGYFNANSYTVLKQDVLRIHNETEGWPAALNVIMMLSRDGSISYGENTLDYIIGFFETEIWTGLDEDTKYFLLKTSVLETLTPSSCYAVTGISETLPLLKHLFANGLFISRLDSGNAYQYHRMFKSFLLLKLDASGIDKSGLYKKIAWWLFERNAIKQSFIYFFKAGDLYGISRVFGVLTPANADINIDDYLDLTSCVINFDAKSLRNYPVILARMAMIRFLLGDIAEMQRLHTIFRKWMESGELPASPEEYGEYLWEEGWLHYIDPDVEVYNNKKHEEWSNYSEYVPHLKAIHTKRFSVMRFPSALSGIRDYCSVVYTIEDAIKWNEKTGNSVLREEYTLFELQLINAEYAYEVEDYTKAARILRRIMPVIEEHKITSLYFVCTVLLVKLARAAHNPKEVGALVDRLETMILENGESYLLPNFHAFQQRNWLLSEQTGFIDIFKEENRNRINKPYFYLIYRHMAYVRGLLSTDCFNEALLVLGNMDTLCRKYKRVMDMMEVNRLRSVALYGLGDEGGACQYLLETLNEAEKYGFIRIFADDAKDIKCILEIICDSTTNIFAKKIMISCKKMLARSGIKPKNLSYGGLTKTEVNILKSLRIGMSYEEIAMDKNIKVSTVKTHAHSIYSKLEVNNRAAAVVTAQNMGIID